MKITDVTVSSSLRVVEPGLWIIRYFESGSVSAPPAVMLTPAPIGKGSIDFFPGEGVTRNTLTKPGDCLVARVKGGAASLLVSEFHPAGQAAQVKLRIDKVDTSFAGSAAKAPAPQRATQPSAAQPLSDTLNQLNQLSRLTGAATGQGIQIKLVGHIERRGDVVVHNDWLGTPTSTQRIEGFSISCEGLPAGVSLGYSCRSDQQATPQVALAGNFVGTRRQAKPITAVAFNLGGAKSADYALSGSVVFAGQPPIAIVTGQELRGLTGREPLVALRLSISPAPRETSSSPWDDPAITEIFRAP